MKRRQLLLSSLCAVPLSVPLGPLLVRNAFAQSTFPERPVKIVVPFGPGGLADVTFRIVAEKLSPLLGKQVVIENMPGAGGIAAGNAVRNAKPDGHTLLVIANGTAITKSLFKTMPFDIERDFVPVSLAAWFDLVIVAKGEGGKYRSEERRVGKECA